MPDNESIKSILSIYKALSDETRLQIVYSVLAKGTCGTGDCTKDLDLSQPTLSHHISILIEAKVLILNKIGTCNQYSLNVEYLDELGIQIIKPK